MGAILLMLHILQDTKTFQNSYFIGYGRKVCLISHGIYRCFLPIVFHNLLLVLSELKVLILLRTDGLQKYHIYFSEQ